MSEYIRTTRACDVSQLHPELLRALGTYFHEHSLGDSEAEIQSCCETISKKKERNKLISWISDKLDTTIHTGMLLTSDRLIWAHFGVQSGTLVNAASLNKIGVRYHVALFTKDVGLEIVGYIGDSNARVRGSIGMGKEVAAQKFCEEVRQAIIKANPPSPRGIFNWPAG
jgi:hypothetical protein